MQLYDIICTQFCLAITFLNLIMSLKLYSVDTTHTTFRGGKYETTAYHSLVFVDMLFHCRIPGPYCGMCEHVSEGVQTLRGTEGTVHSLGRKWYGVELRGLSPDSSLTRSARLG